MGVALPLGLSAGLGWGLGLGSYLPTYNRFGGASSSIMSCAKYNLPLKTCANCSLYPNTIYTLLIGNVVYTILFFIPTPHRSTNSKSTVDR